MTRPPGPGWYPDPGNAAGSLRWWDGIQWTATVKSIHPPRSARPGKSVERGSKLKDSLFDKWYERWSQVLAPNESLSALTRASAVRPPLNSMAVTNKRVMAGWAEDLAKSGPKVQVSIERLSRFEIRKQMSGHFLYITNNVNETQSFGRLEEGDVTSGLIENVLSTVAPWSQPRPDNLSPEADSSAGASAKTEATTKDAPEAPEGFVPYATATPQHQAPVEFDSSTPPQEGTRVPADCVWAEIPHPGPIPRGRKFGDTASRMVALGTIAGRTEREIVSFVGPPNSRNSIGNGGYILQWIKISAWSNSSHYVLRFDRYGVCWGIDHEFG